MIIFFNLPPTLNHLHPLQVENCDSNSRLVLDEDDNGKFRLERVKHVKRRKSVSYYCMLSIHFVHYFLVTYTNSGFMHEIYIIMKPYYVIYLFLD